MEEGGEQRGRHHHSRGGVSGRGHSSRRLLLGEKWCSHGLCKPQVREEASFFFFAPLTSVLLSAFGYILMNPYN